jgi:hypothetical protein
LPGRFKDPDARRPVEVPEGAGEPVAGFRLRPGPDVKTIGAPAIEAAVRLPLLHAEEAARLALSA